jgi:bacterioferritin
MSADSSNPQPIQIHPFLSNVVKIRRRARSHIGEDGGAAGTAADRDAVVRLLNTALATEMLCVVRYRRYGASNAPALAETLRQQFTRRAQQEQGHADRIVARIVELGGEPNPDPPDAVERSDRDDAEHDAAKYDDGEYDDSENLADMLAEDLIVERIAIDTYREIIRYVGDSDATTRRLFESIVTVEQQHAAGLASLRENIQRQDRAAGANPTAGVAEDAR